MNQQRHAGFYPLSELPQRGSVADIAIGCGWDEMSELWKIYPGQFTIVTGIAGHGKSTFLLNVICNLARSEGMKTFLYVPENEGHVREKFKLIWGDRPGFDKFCSEHCFVQSAMPEFYDTAPKTLQWVLDQAALAVESEKIDLLMIDPWNELERAKPKEMMMTDYIGQCLMYLKQFCRAMNVAVILVAHPTKAGVEQGKTPTLADIEGSMNWYNKCDNGLIVVRDAHGSTAKVISAKVREIGARAAGSAISWSILEPGFSRRNMGGFLVKPWLTDLMYGGMSQESARRSYEAWVRQGSKPLRFKAQPASDEEIGLAKRRVEACLAESEAAIEAAKKWSLEWKIRQRSRGFQCVQEQREL